MCADVFAAATGVASFLAGGSAAFATFGNCQQTLDTGAALPLGAATLQHVPDVSSPGQRGRPARPLADGDANPSSRHAPGVCHSAAASSGFLPPPCSLLCSSTPRQILFWWASPAGWY